MTTRYIFLPFYNFTVFVKRYAQLAIIGFDRPTRGALTIDMVKYLFMSCKDTDVWSLFEAISERVEACLYTILPEVIMDKFRVPTASYKSYNLTYCPIFVLYLSEEGICPIFSLRMSYKSYNLGVLSYILSYN